LWNSDNKNFGVRQLDPAVVFNLKAASSRRTPKYLRAIFTRVLAQTSARLGILNSAFTPPVQDFTYRFLEAITCRFAFRESFAVILFSAHPD
jgi:hypothetical protein